MMLFVDKYLVTPVKRNVVQPLLQVIRGGISARSLALSIAIGIAGGLFPIPFITTAVALTLSLPFGNHANKVIVTVFNLLMTVPDVLMMPGFIAVGHWVLGTSNTVEVSAILEGLKHDTMGTVMAFGSTLLTGVLGWVVMLPLMVAFVYVATRPVAAFIVRKTHTATVPDGDGGFHET